ncbi:alpha/beta fold hydrolase [Pseudomonas sp. ABC1]|uniref:alpha/beta fold hydrolase n=1 Tax=Pseudomonas sp. ABC1 TaxID=2748080 RepID=UPI0015C3980F|nr:alpha/beta hydrolase [Pseudomonas sp. ABC1]QLF94669.1 alpha/beta fold hydrolase [Pseudomonas sp. ABC1]
MAVFNHQDGRHIEVDGAQLYMEQQGNPDGPVLVFLHGGVGDIETFNAITPHLAGQYRLIGIDTRGHGKSTLGTAPLSYARIQRDVQAVLHSLGVPRFTLIGHSDGGIAALRLAAARAPGLDRFVTIGAHWALPKDDPTRALYQGITAADWREMFPHSYNSYQALNPAPDFEALVAAVRDLWLDTGPDGYPAESVRDIEACLLAVRGDEDPLVSRSNALELVERVPGAALLNIPFTDHSPHEDRPQWLLAPLLHFLQVD